MHKERIQWRIFWLHGSKRRKWHSNLVRVETNQTYDNLFRPKMCTFKLTLQKPTFVLILAKYIVLCEVSAKGPASRITTYDLPFPPTENTRPSYLNKATRRCKDRIHIHQQKHLIYVMLNTCQVYIPEEARASSLNQHSLLS